MALPVMGMAAAAEEEEEEERNDPARSARGKKSPALVHTLKRCGSVLPGRQGRRTSSNCVLRDSPDRNMRFERTPQGRKRCRVENASGARGSSQAFAQTAAAYGERLEVASERGTTQEQDLAPVAQASVAVLKRRS